MAGFSLTVIWRENGCYLFDSHSRYINGFPSPIGTSVLLKFGSVYEVQEYIREVYFAQASNMSQYYQIQYLNAVPPPVEVRHFILETLGRKRQRETSIGKRTQLMPSAHATIREQSHKRQQKRRCKLSEFEKNDITLKNTLYQKSGRKKYSTEKAVAKFKEEVKKGPFYICVVCNRTLYTRTVQMFEKNKYQVETCSVFDYMVRSADGKQYICIICHKKSLKGTVPAQTVCNNLQIFELSSRFRDLRKLEKIIIAKQLLFKKVTIMPKAQCPKIKGAICNVPVNADDICKVLPGGMDNNGVVQLCLKKKLNFKSHVLFEAVRPKVVHGVLDFFKKNNARYYDIDINLGNIPKNWVNTIETNEDQNIPDCHIQKTKVINRDHITFIDDNQPLKIFDFSLKDDSAEKDNVEEESNPLDDYWIPSSETAYVADVQYDLRDDAGLVIAPGENKMPLPIISDENCELLAHAYLFLTGKFGYTYKRGISLSSSKYFNQRLLNYSQKFASDSDCIFFAQSVM